MRCPLLVWRVSGRFVCAARNESIECNLSIARKRQIFQEKVWHHSVCALGLTWVKSCDKVIDVWVVKLWRCTIKSRIIQIWHVQGFWKYTWTCPFTMWVVNCWLSHRISWCILNTTMIRASHPLTPSCVLLLFLSGSESKSPSGIKTTKHCFYKSYNMMTTRSTIVSVTKCNYTISILFNENSYCLHYFCFPLLLWGQNNTLAM